MVGAVLKFAICLALVAITFAVFGQTLGHDFVNYDDPVYVSENPEIQSGLTFAQLASVHDDVAHARLATVRPKTGRPSFDERALALRERRFAFSFAATYRSLGLGQRVCRRALCDSSAACRIGGVDLGTQRRLERVVLFPDALCLHSLHTKAERCALRDDVDLVRVWFVVETDASHAAGNFAFARLLAAEKI